VEKLLDHAGKWHAPRKFQLFAVGKLQIQVNENRDASAEKNRRKERKKRNEDTLDLGEAQVIAKGLCRDPGPAIFVSFNRLATGC
jgi:hypothetical protein